MNHLELASVVREVPRGVVCQPVSVPMLASTKLQTCHLSKRAIVYVRQSTPQQIIDHRESTERQYALVDRAVAMGWPREQVIVIDDDQGQSGKSAEGRRSDSRTTQPRRLSSSPSTCQLQCRDAQPHRAQEGDSPATLGSDPWLIAPAGS